MNPSLRKELSLVVGAAALFSLFRGRKATATGLGVTAIGLALIDLPGSYSYRGRSVVITGGSRGLGLAIARRLLKLGAKVTLIARDQDELRRAETMLSDIAPAYVFTVVADVTKGNEFENALAATESRFGQIDVLINNAGAISVGPFESMETSDYEAQIDLHLKAVVTGTRLALPYFRRLGGGRIINISSLGGKIPLPHMSAYSASKFALAGFSRAVAPELRRENIFVTTVYPGLLRTGSSIQAVFKGDHEKEYAWFAMADVSPLLSTSAETAAKTLLDAAAHGQGEVIISLSAKLGAFAFNNFPEIFNLLSSFATRLLPRGQSRVRKTGADSSHWLQSQAWAKRWIEFQKEIQIRWNQVEKTDAAMNLGIRQSEAVTSRS